MRLTCGVDVGGTKILAGLFDDQFRLLDSYAAVNLFDNEISIGKQSLWWGSGEGGPLALSDNAEPIYMLRLNRVTPIRLGPVAIRFDAFFGKLSGNLFPRQAFIHGEKVSIKPTQNLEFGFTRTAEFAGIGRALTGAAAYNSYFSFRESIFFGRNDNPGKRTGGFDLNYRVPFLRDWMTVYLDSISADDPSPLDAPRRSAISPGLYLSHLPKLPRVDFRAEGVYTETPSSSVKGHFIYYDFFYHDLYTNKNDIIGSWIGREGRGIQAWSTYWFTPRNSVQIGYRNAKVAPDFIPHGASQNDFNIKADFRLRHDLALQTFLQYENWLVPVIAPDRRSDLTTSVQLTFWPKNLRLRLRGDTK